MPAAVVISTSRPFTGFPATARAGSAAINAPAPASAAKLRRPTAIPARSRSASVSSVHMALSSGRFRQSRRKLGNFTRDFICRPALGIEQRTKLIQPDFVGQRFFCSKYPPCRAAMGSWQREALTEGLWRYRRYALPPSAARTVPLPLASPQGGLSRDDCQCPDLTKGQ